MIKQELDRIKERISNKDFLENKGLSNEVGIHVFCYKAEDELIVQDYIRRLKSEVNTPYRIIECDLYEVFLSLLEDKRILKSVAGLEEKRRQKVSSGSVAEDRHTGSSPCQDGLFTSYQRAGCSLHDRNWKNSSVYAFP